ncbi:hypothetical protein [Trichormus variabilis]|uniref:hypothetical protein n=1 Tax=Anabaena variabilis TaxID=264691 RepID=UPI000CE27A7B|nr:hypothetical protein [Trichormus variabilis 9RC]MBC1324582.1 hypothetical protein [Trichormus variabilis 9RC]QHD81630.1 hypothetical protein GSQ19_18470 [Trichormus variabilis 0441]
MPISNMEASSAIAISVWERAIIRVFRYPRMRFSVSDRGLGIGDWGLGTGEGEAPSGDKG